MKVHKIQKKDRMQNNTYILLNDFQECLVVDTSYNEKEVLEYIKSNSIKLVGVLITHGHYDHYGNSELIVKELNPNAKIYLNEKEIPLIDLKLLSYRIRAITEINVDFNLIEFFSENQILKIGNFEIKTLCYPGHTPGSTLFEFDNKWLFTGDFVFDKYIGVDFLPLSNSEEMKRSCIRFINEVKNHLLVMPGHYDSGVSVGQIKISNQELLEKTK